MPSLSIRFVGSFHLPAISKREIVSKFLYFVCPVSVMPPKPYKLNSVDVSLGGKRLPMGASIEQPRSPLATPIVL